MKIVLREYFALRKAFPKMSPSSAWFHATVQASIIEVTV